MYPGPPRVQVNAPCADDRHVQVTTPCAGDRHVQVITHVQATVMCR